MSNIRDTCFTIHFTTHVMMSMLEVSRHFWLVASPLPNVLFCLCVLFCHAYRLFLKIHYIICHSWTDLQKMERWIDRRMDEKFRPFSNPYPNIAVKIRWAAVRSQTHCIMLMYTICSPANRSLHDVSVIISIPSLTGPSVPLHGLDSRQAGD